MICAAPSRSWSRRRTAIVLQPGLARLRDYLFSSNEIEYDLSAPGYVHRRSTGRRFRLASDMNFSPGSARRGPSSAG